MDEMSSVEFRKRYGKLKEPVTVTVNGHAIGVWLPGPIQFDPDTHASFAMSAEAERRGGGTASMTFPAPDRFGAPRPAPKPGKR